MCIVSTRTYTSYVTLCEFLQEFYHHMMFFGLLLQMQVLLLTKFIYIAKCLQDVQNYATCIAIVDGLDNLIVRQLPVSPHNSMFSHVRVHCLYVLMVTTEVPRRDSLYSGWGRLYMTIAY